MNQQFYGTGVYGNCMIKSYTKPIVCKGYRGDKGRVERIDEFRYFICDLDCEEISKLCNLQPILEFLFYNLLGLYF